MPELLKELEYYVDIGGVDDVGTGPFGHRMIAAGAGGQVVGDRLKGTIAASAGGDWLLLGQDGYRRLDVRNTLQTVDGAFIYIQLHGLVELTPGIMNVFTGSDTPTHFGQQYFFTSTRMETDDERYAWVNQTLFVGEARLTPGPRIEYRLYRVANS
jgi:hypothetical protein